VVHVVHVVPLLDDLHAISNFPRDSKLSLGDKFLLVQRNSPSLAFALDDASPKWKSLPHFDEKGRRNEMDDWGEEEEGGKKRASRAKVSFKAAEKSVAVRLQVRK